MTSSGALRRAALGAVAAERGRRLGRQADVALDRDPGVDDRAGALHGHAAAFELDRVDARLLDEALGGGDRLRVGGLVGAEGQVGDQERRLQPAAHGARQHDHLVHRHGHGGVIAEHGHGARVADQHHVDAGGLGHLGRGEVVGGDHDDGLAALALVGQRRERDRQAVVGGGVGGLGSGGHQAASGVRSVASVGIDVEDAVAAVDVDDARLVAVELALVVGRVGDDDHGVAAVDEPRGGAVDHDLARPPRPRDRVGLEAGAVVDVHDVHLLVARGRPRPRAGPGRW